MFDAKDIFKDVTTIDDSDEIIERLLSNKRINEFVMQNDLSNKDIILNMNVLLNYESDETYDDELNIVSKMFPDFTPILSISEGVIKINYKSNKKDEPKIDSINVPEELLSAKLSDYSLITEERRLLYQYARNFINSFDDKKPLKGLYLSGSFRTGKTYLAAAIGNELVQKGYNAVMVYYPELSSTLKSYIGEDEFRKTINQLENCDLLILDDFGGEALNPFIRDEALGVILNYRMIKNKPVIFTSNVPLNRLSDTSLRRDGSEGEKIKAMRIIERIKELSSEYILTSKYDDLNKKY